MIQRILRLSRPVPRTLGGCCLLLAVTAVGFALRWSQIREPLWLDELHTSWVVDASWSDVSARARIGNQSPLYFYLVWGAVRLGGQQEWVLRFPTLLAGTVLILAAGWLARSLSGAWWAALITALLIAVDRDCVFYTQEARPYALVQLGAVLHAAVFFQLLHNPRPVWRLAWVAGAAMLFYLHYTAVLFLLAEAVGYAVVAGRVGRPAYRPGQALCDSACVALLLLPAAGHVLEVAGRRENWEPLAHPWSSPALANILLGLVVLPVLALAGGRWAGCPHDQTPRQRTALLLSVCWWAVPLSVAWLCTVGSLAALWMVRYLVAAVTGAVVFAGLASARYPSRLYRGLVGTAVVAVSLYLGGMVHQRRMDGRWIGDRCEHWNQLVAALNESGRGRVWPVFLSAGLLEDAGLGPASAADLTAYCRFPVEGIYRLEGPAVEPLSSSGSPQLSWRQCDRIRRAGGFWLVLRATRQGSHRRLQRLLAVLPRHGLTGRPSGWTEYGDLLTLVSIRVTVSHTRSDPPARRSPQTTRESDPGRR